MIPSPPVVLTIAGSDCSAGAGLQADLKTFQAHRVFGLTAATCVVAETPAVVRSIHAVPPAVLQDQVRLLLESYPVAAIKTGMLCSRPHLVAVAEILAEWPKIPLVVDPVMMASTGASLLEAQAVKAYEERLFPRASVITPNLDEAGALWGRPVKDGEEMERCARELSARYGTAVLLKGGHLPGPECCDLLVAGDWPEWYRAPRLEVAASHGTGCTLSAALTANLALGQDLHEAVRRAKVFLEAALRGGFLWGPLAALDQGATVDF